MSNAKRFLSVILAMIMVLSTLVIGASAYSAYKGDAIKGQYNKLDKPVLTTDQYASAAQSSNVRVAQRHYDAFLNQVGRNEVFMRKTQFA